MRLPNGFGNVSKLSGKRRNPWRARKTSGWIIDEKTQKAKQTYITIGYEDGIDIAAGDVISLYVGNVFIGSWIYNESNALSDIKIRAVRGSGKVLRGVWKMLKKRI